MLLTTYKHFLFLMVTWGPSPFKKTVSLFPSLCESQVCDNSPKYQVFHEHNFVVKMVPKDHFFYSFQILQTVLQSHAALLSPDLKSCLEILRKVIKRTSQVSEPTIHLRSLFSFAFSFLTPFQSHNLALGSVKVI